MPKIYYCVSSVYDDNDNAILGEWPKHDDLEIAKQELADLSIGNLYKIYKVTYEIGEINE